MYTEGNPTSSAIADPLGGKVTDVTLTVEEETDRL